MHQAADESVSDPRRRLWKKAVRIAALMASAAAMLVVMAMLALWLMFPMRQSVVRAGAHAQLERIAQAARIYESDTGVRATLEHVLNSGHFAGVQLEAYSRASPISESDTGLPLVVQTVPCRAVRKGESWGGIEQTIDHDLPACRYVLMPDWTVVQMDEPDYQRDIAPRLTLTPLN
ncbi:MAG: hypothetical protein WC718_03835 [Phycisphaerales bacterium]|jgi:hypothetical protein